MTTHSDEPDDGRRLQRDAAPDGDDTIRDDQTLERILRNAGAREVPSSAAMDDVRVAVEAEWRAIVRGRQVRTRRWAWPLVAGVAAAAVGIAVLINRPGAPAETVATVDRLEGSAEHRGVDSDDWQALTVGSTLRGRDEIRTSGEARIALTLATGLQVRVDRASQLALDDGTHATLVAGAVYVDSGPSPSARPSNLEISTAHGSVSHLGTQYEARLDASSLVVSVREGRVSVARGPDRIEGAAGERLVIADGRIERASIARTAPSWGWIGEIAPTYQLEGQTLLQFLAWAARETGRDIRFEEAAARDDAGALDLHGSVEGLTPDEALTAVLATTTLPVTVDTDYISVGARIR